MPVLEMPRGLERGGSMSLLCTKENTTDDDKAAVYNITIYMMTKDISTTRRETHMPGIRRKQVAGS